LNRYLTFLHSRTLAIAICTASLIGSSLPQEDKSCSKDNTFCWWGPYADKSDEVTAFGSRWSSQDKTEKSLEWITEVRCIRSRNLCIHAHNQLSFGVRQTSIDLFKVTRWTDFEINAVADEGPEPCEKNSLVLNRPEKSAILVSIPGRLADKQTCTALMGPPKTVMYRLVP
jgi:hypothetical protein